MSHVRAKFQCKFYTQHAGYKTGVRGSREFHFEAVSADEVPENQRFHKATPSGKLSMYVDNEEVNFEPGKCYYLDFTLAD